MKKLLLSLALLSASTVTVSADWTNYLYDRDYVIGYGFAGHKAPMIMTHPRVSFMGGSYSTNAHETCMENGKIRTLSPKTICVEREKEFELVTSKKDEDEKVLKWTGDYICVKTVSKILSKNIHGTKEICENRGTVIAAWKKANQDDDGKPKYNNGKYPECTLKRVVNTTATTKFKVFVAEKANKNDENYDDDFNKNWGGYPVSAEMWTIPSCR